MGAQGVVTSSGGTLVISDSIFRHNAGDGISQQAGSLTLERVRSEDNEGRGLYIPTGTASIDSSSFQQNFGEGIRVEDGGKVSVRASVISGNQSDGIFVNAFNSSAQPTSSSTTAWSTPTAPMASKRTPQVPDFPW